VPFGACAALTYYALLTAGAPPRACVCMRVNNPDSVTRFFCCCAVLVYVGIYSLFVEKGYQQARCLRARARASLRRGLLEVSPCFDQH
jgi:hypothetical protein